MKLFLETIVALWSLHACHPGNSPVLGLGVVLCLCFGFADPQMCSHTYPHPQLPGNTALELPCPLCEFQHRHVVPGQGI